MIYNDYATHKQKVIKKNEEITDFNKKKLQTGVREDDIKCTFTTGVARM